MGWKTRRTREARGGYACEGMPTASLIEAGNCPIGRKACLIFGLLARYCGYRRRRVLVECCRAWLPGRLHTPYNAVDPWPLLRVCVPPSSRIAKDDTRAPAAANSDVYAYSRAGSEFVSC
ncbi:hypothetical protein BV20DRAFT_964698 [Pilatotrama ljubarskyi]|nr:hypothetical protein BV20DRAFT_964698 [Pilatotrama ljubarskyi]